MDILGFMNRNVIISRLRDREPSRLGVEASLVRLSRTGRRQQSSDIDLAVRLDPDRTPQVSTTSNFWTGSSKV